MAVCLYPELLKEKSLPLDVRQRAQKLLDMCSGGSVGEKKQLYLQAMHKVSINASAGQSNHFACDRFILHNLRWFTTSPEKHF